jgi:uncharacterized membrane protein
VQQPPVGRPFGYGYERPSTARGRPAVITWFRVYAIATVLFYVVFIAGWIFASTGPAIHDPDRALTLLVIGSVVFLLGAFYAVAAMVPFKPWGWTLGLVAICLGLSSCMVFAAVPLLIFWMKPETKAAFGRL